LLLLYQQPPEVTQPHQYKYPHNLHFPFTFPHPHSPPRAFCAGCRQRGHSLAHCSGRRNGSGCRGGRNSALLVSTCRKGLHSPVHAKILNYGQIVKRCHLQYHQHRLPIQAPFQAHLYHALRPLPVTLRHRVAQLAAVMAKLNGQGATDLPFHPQEPSESHKPAPDDDRTA
jgi:hypothetical protein